MANPNIEAAYFWVQIGQNETNEKFKVKGSDFPNVAKGPEMVWVQRGDDHYWTWFGAPKDENNPDYTYRFNYFVEGFNENLPGDQRTQPDGDGLINLSLYFEAPGPYPVNEWRNIRNQQNVVKDLDNKELILRNNPDLKEGDVCRITHEGGDFEAWYVVDTPGGNNYLTFKTLYEKSEEDNRERTDVKRTGTRPAPDGNEVLRFDFYAAEKATPYNRIADTDWVWAQGNDGVKYKVSGKNFKELFVSASISSNTASVNTGVTYTISWNCTGGVQYRLKSPARSYDVSASSYMNFYSSSAGNNTFTIEVLGADGSVLASDSVIVEVIAPATASISSNTSSVNTGSTFSISWNCSGGVNYKLYSSTGLSWDVKESDTWNFSAGTTSQNITFTIEVHDASGSVLASDSVSVQVIPPPTASISSNKTQAGEGEIFRISWTASGGSSYKLYDDRDGSRYTVSSNSSKEFSASSGKSTRSFYIEIYDSSNVKIASESVDVAQLGSGKKWKYSTTIAHGGAGKWGSGASKSKFHNTDANNYDQRVFWGNFRAGTRKVKLDGSYYDVYMPAIDNVGSGSGGISSFNVIIDWPFTYPPSSGSEIVIFDLPS